MIKVASYCRVSTEKEDQTNSFESQQRFFREYIARHPDWELYDVYADEGITGTSTNKRIQFNRMMNDAYSGRFQMIITKEVSRFSRNILDTISYTRELKALGIGVIFMSDGFCTLDPDAELRLSIMGSIAQEESRKTSSRVKWGQTRQMEKGVVFGRSMLGYDVENGSLSINSDGADLVKLIFYKYGIEKKGTTAIARELREAGYKTYSGNLIWSDSHILKILRNEKYVGDLVQKKTITPDYLTHSRKYNHGEEELIIIRNHHEPIISRSLWDSVQEEIGKRHRTRRSSNAHSNRYVFSGKIICAECGARFVSRKKVRKDGTTYRCWGCYSASRDGKRKIDSRGNVLGCDVGKQIRDDLAVEMLRYVVRHIGIDRDWIIKNLSNLLLQVLRDDKQPTDNPKKLQNQIDAIKEKKIRAIDCYLSGELTADEFSEITNRYDLAQKELQDHLKQTSVKDSHDDRTDLYRTVESIITCSVTPDAFLKSLLEYMMIHKDGTVDLKLNEVDTIWKLELYKANQYLTNISEEGDCQSDFEDAYTDMS